MRPRTWSPKRNKKLKNDTASGGLIQGENFTGPGAKEPKIKKRKVLGIGLRVKRKGRKLFVKGQVKKTLIKDLMIGKRN